VNAWLKRKREVIIMAEKRTFTLKQAAQQGLLSGVIALSLSVIGLVTLFQERDLITGIFTLGQLILFLAPAALAFTMAGKAAADEKGKAILYGLVIGVVTALPLILLTVLATAFDIRQFLVNVSPALVELLTFSQSIAVGSLILIAVLGTVGAAGAGVQTISGTIKKALLNGLLWTLSIGLFSEILSGRIRDFFGSAAVKLIFKSKALNPIVALIIFVLVIALTFWRAKRGNPMQDRVAAMNPTQLRNFRWLRIGLAVVGLLIMPIFLGTYLSEVVNNVGIYIIMGMGLNIVVGFAGLLDLGYVAFFAIGAYTMAILTTQGHLGASSLNFWMALPICVIAAITAGVILGVPVLRMRGDYLAIVTLGFGEIIRIMALSDLLKTKIGGAQGVLQIPKPAIGSLTLSKPEHLYYVILGGVALAAFISWRLRDSRLGRQWMAMREDEDVAEAMGINLVSTKLLAFAIGAGFSGLSGAIFASKLTSIFPHSFDLLKSIYVLCLIIVGGIGSLPGVVVGALVLMGLPELLREFAEYRMLMYGALLVVMMLARPEGFVPSAVMKRELHAHEDDNIESAGATD
jgi:branched-chain amino acid transport system permease protein